MKDGSRPWQRFSGIRIVGDVHGEAEAFKAVNNGASTKHLFVVQLGDLVDRGPDSVGALRLALDLRERGLGLFLRSNHDDKLRRALRGNPVKIGLELRSTLDGLGAAPDRDALIPRVRKALDTAPWWLRAGGYLLVHGAFHPAMLTALGPQAISPRHVADKCRWLALYGEGSMSGADDELPTRTYHWIDTVPAETTVVIGHDAIATDKIVERRGAMGGRVLFCDTGAGKGGKLSYIDVAISA
jgi:protein phosphatase